jgi:AraC-like DNA-binding protein
LLGTDVLTTIADREDAVVLTSRFAEPEHDPRRYFREFWMITWHRLACWLLGETAPMQKAEFDYARPVYFDEFRHLFPTVHVFDTEQSALWIEARALSGPVRRTQAELEAMIAVAPLDIMTIPASDVSLGRRVRAILARDPAQSQAAIATELGLKEDALRRKLRLEGARISAVREDVRRDLSLRALTRTNRSIESIAEDLGYNEARSFTRAFRSWTGVSPSSYRRC